jgi:hypothetical protein
MRISLGLSAARAIIGANPKAAVRARTERLESGMLDEGIMDL